jgi:hypothetical protein
MLIILEGLDRSYKTSFAKMLEAKGFKYIHMSAPSKKYTEKSYVGPSYLDEMIDLMSSIDGQDVIMDRSYWGEVYIWPQVYGRKPQLDIEDLGVLREFEDKNDTFRFLFTDSNVEAHWQRCVDNKEPLTRQQFAKTSSLYAKSLSYDSATPGSFIKVQKTDVDNGSIWQHFKNSTRKDLAELAPVENPVAPAVTISIDTTTIAPAIVPTVVPSLPAMSPEQIKLAEANAINEILNSKIINKTGQYFDVLEQKIRLFLNEELSVLLGTKKQTIPVAGFSADEVQFLRILLNKAKGQK